MAIKHGLGTYGNAVGVVTPGDHKLAQAGLVVKNTSGAIRAGVFFNGTQNIVSGKANMSYDVAAFTAATTRGASSGAVLLPNDGVVNVVTGAAPGSNSRIDVVYVWPREYSLDGVNSDPVIGVAQGTPGAIPSVPSLAAFPGALELARITVPAGVTATNSGTTITQTFAFTAAAGGTVPFNTKTEMDLVTTLPRGTSAVVLADLIGYVFNGTSWVSSGLGAWISYTPVLTAIGGSTVTAEYRYESGLVRVRFKIVLTGATMGTNPEMTLPVAAITPAHGYAQYNGLGSSWNSVASAAASTMFAASNLSTTTVRFYTGSYTPITATSPFTWASGYALQGEFTYRIP